MNWKNISLRHGEVSIVESLCCVLVVYYNVFYYIISCQTEVYLQATFKPLVNISPDARYVYSLW